MFNWLRYILTDEKNQWDIGILMWIAGVMLYLYRGLTATWDFQAFGIGFAGVLGAGIGLQWIRQKGNETTTTTAIGTPPIVIQTKETNEQSKPVLDKGN